MISSEHIQPMQQAFRITLVFISDPRLGEDVNFFSPRSIIGAVSYLDAIYANIEQDILDLLCKNEYINEEQSRTIKDILKANYNLQHAVISLEFGSITIRGAIAGALMLVVTTVVSEGFKDSNPGKQTISYVTEIINEADTIIRSASARVYSESDGGSKFGFMATPPSKNEDTGWFMRGAALDPAVVLSAYPSAFSVHNAPPSNKEESNYGNFDDFFRGMDEKPVPPKAAIIPDPASDVPQPKKQARRARRKS